MSNYFPCFNIGSGCVGPSTTSPAINVSSEDPDYDVFFGRDYTGGSGGNGGDPPLGRDWKASGCLGVCTSRISQADADACAQRQAILCLANRWPVTVPNPDPNPDPGDPPFINPNAPTYPNAEQSCEYVCPDGNTFVYTIPEGTYNALSQAAADSMAAAEACNRALEARICIGNLSSESICLGDDYEETISISALNTPLVVFIVSGALPPGISLDYDDESITLSGVAAGTGAHTFTIQVEDFDGNFMQKEFVLKVATIANAILANGDVGTAYSQTLYYSGAVNDSVQWSIVSGSLPTGLTLNPSTGQISGSPSVAGEFTFTVQMRDGV